VGLGHRGLQGREMKEKAMNDSSRDTHMNDSSQLRQPILFGKFHVIIHGMTHTDPLMGPWDSHGAGLWPFLDGKAHNMTNNHISRHTKHALTDNSGR
jgi:hypothetical protein